MVSNIPLNGQAMWTFNLYCLGNFTPLLVKIVLKVWLSTYSCTEYVLLLAPVWNAPLIPFSPLWSKQHQMNSSPLIMILGFEFDFMPSATAELSCSADLLQLFLAPSCAFFSHVGSRKGSAWSATCIMNCSYYSMISTVLYIINTFFFFIFFFRHCAYLLDLQTFDGLWTQ